MFLVFGLLCIFLSVENYIESGELLVLPMLLGLFGLAAAGVAWMFSKQYEKKKEAEADGTVSSYDAAFDMYHKEQKAELAIPENTTELEIFTKAYSEEESETGGAYSNASVEAFQEGGNLCFFYSGAVIALPMDKIEALVKVDAPVIFDSWLKDVPYDRGNYIKL